MVIPGIRFIVGMLVDGRITTYVRPFGGGNPLELAASGMGDRRSRPPLLDRTINAEYPHDPSAPATHWILVDNAQWDAAMEGLCAALLRPFDKLEEADEDKIRPAARRKTKHSGRHRRRSGSCTQGSIQSGAAQSLDGPWRNDIFGIDRVVEATGLSRSTIYAKVAAGTFPKQIPAHGTRKGWRRGDVQDWLDELPTS